MAEPQMYRVESISSNPSLNIWGYCGAANCYETIQKFIDGNRKTLDSGGLERVTITCFKVTDEEVKLHIRKGIQPSPSS